MLAREAVEWGTAVWVCRSPVLGYAGCLLSQLPLTTGPAPSLQYHWAVISQKTSSRGINLSVLDLTGRPPGSKQARSLHKYVGTVRRVQPKQCRRLLWKPSRGVWGRGPAGTAGGCLWEASPWKPSTHTGGEGLYHSRTQGVTVDISALS